MPYQLYNSLQNGINILTCAGTADVSNCHCHCQLRSKNVLNFFTIYVIEIESHVRAVLYENVCIIVIVHVIIINRKIYTD